MATNSKEIYCPVCGYSLGFLPWGGDLPSDEICPCCGIHFGYHDFAAGKAEDRPQKYKELRTRWIAQGMNWYSRSEPIPENWDPKKQLEKADQRHRP